MKNALQVSIFSVNCPASKITRHHAVGQGVNLAALDFFF